MATPPNYIYINSLYACIFSTQHLTPCCFFFKQQAEKKLIYVPSVEVTSAVGETEEVICFTAWFFFMLHLWSAKHKYLCMYMCVCVTIVKSKCVSAIQGRDYSNGLAFQDKYSIAFYLQFREWIWE